MKLGVWVSDEKEKVLQIGVPVILEYIREGAAPIFCGVVKKSIAGKEKGKAAFTLRLKLQAASWTRKKEAVCSRGRGSYQELIGEISAPYQGYPVWEKGAGGEQACGFYFNMKKPTGN